MNTIDNSYVPNQVIVQRLNEIEERRDLLRYEVDGWSAWPLVRSSIARALQHKPQDAQNDQLTRLELMKIALNDIKCLMWLPRARIFAKTYSSAQLDTHLEKRMDIHLDILLEQMGSFFKVELINSPAFFRNQEQPYFPADISTTAIDMLVERFKRIPAPSSMARVAGELSRILDDELGQSPLTPNQMINRFSEFYWQKRMYKWLMQKVRPEYFIVADCGQLSCMAAARELNIRTIEFQHGFLDRFHFAYAWSAYGRRYKSKMPLPEKLLLFGDYWKEELLATGFWQDELESVGSIQLDRYRKNERDRQHGPYQILVTTQGIDTSNLIKFLLEFIEGIHARNDVKLRIKTHPVFDKSLTQYQMAFANYPNVEIISPEAKYSTLELVAQSNLHVSIFSTCHFEAIGLGVPTVILPLAGHENVLHLSRQGDAQFIQTPQQLADLVQSPKTKRNDFPIGDRFYKPNALDNISAIIPFVNKQETI